MNIKERIFEAKVKKSREVIRKALDKWHPNVGVVWSTDEESTLCLHLTRQFKSDIPVLFSDTTVHFPETYQFRDSIAEEWKLNLINMKPDTTYEEVKGESERCCHHLKTLPALKAIKSLRLEAVIVGIRWSERPAEAAETYFSKREDPPHWRVHPLLHWNEEDVWRFTKANNLPHNPLYDKGYGSFDCQPCTKPTAPEAAERAEKDRDKEEIMRRLRNLGYW